MDTIEYRCPLHGTIAIRDHTNVQHTEDHRTCPIEGPNGPCGRVVTVEFVQHGQHLRVS